MTQDNQNNFLRSSKMQAEPIMNVLFQNQSKQILQVQIPPNCSVCINGKVQYSNYHNPDENAILTPKGSIFSKPKLEMYQWKNKTQHMQVIGLTHLTNRGPILFLDYSVYKESFYVNKSNIIASRYNIESSVKKCPQIPSLILIEYKDKVSSLDDYFKSKQKIALQSSQPIIEKYLGVGEEFVLYQNPLAVSESLLIEPIKTKKVFNAVKYTGPGWLFFPIEPFLEGKTNLSKYAPTITYVVMYLAVQLLLIFGK